jgi:signal transduction histidine kinase
LSAFTSKSPAFEQPHHYAPGPGLAATSAEERDREAVTASVGHDLRNSLALIAMHASLLLELEAPFLGTPPSGPLKHVDAIAKAGRRMLRLLDDLRDAASIEPGESSFRATTTPIGDLLGEVISLHLPAAEQKGLALSIELGPNLPLVSIDADRIFQVVTNIVGNALALTPRAGQITLAACCGYDALVVAVSDTGPGMTPATKERIFERFFRGSSAYPGCGLGLSIARRIVEQHGGRIWVETELDRGTTVAFTLPLEERETDYRRETRGALRR